MSNKEELKTVKEHLIDLKKLLSKNFIIFVLFFILLFFFGEKIILFFIDYFKLSLFVLSPLEMIKTQMMVAIYLSILFILPFFMIQLFIFSKTLIKEKMKKKVLIYFSSSIFLAIIGFLFGIFIFSKFSLNFFNALPQEIIAMWGVYESINFIMINGFAFSLTLQTIIIIPILVNLGLLNIETLKKSRGIVIVISFIISAIITPPDIVTQTLMALPLLICLEIGMLISKI